MTEWHVVEGLEESVVPWYSPEEFLKVYEQLFSSDLSHKREAVEQIAVWESRCCPSLPAAIEATLCLTRAIIQDTLFHHGTTLCQERDIEMLYSMALVRFVNLAVEVHQSSSENLPNAWVAQKVGIPTWIVDLRNAATHSTAPSLAVLRIGADAALKYIDATYWRVISKNLRNIVNDPVDCDSIRNLVLEFQVHQYKLMGSKKNFGDRSETEKEMKLILKSIFEIIRKHKDIFIDTLILDGLFISYEDDLRIMLTKREFSEFIGNTSVTSEDMEQDCGEKFSLPILPNTLEEFWAPVFSALNKNEAIPDLMEKLLYSQADRNQIGQRLLASWIIRILKIILMPSGAPVTCLEKIFSISSPLIDWERLLFAAVFKPCIYTPYYFPLIACHMDLEEDYARALMNLLAISQGQALDGDINKPVNQPIFTLEKLKKTKKLQEARRKHKKKETSNWSLASDDIDWSKIPIGTVFKSAPGDKTEVIDSSIKIDFHDDYKYPEHFIYGNKNADMKGDITSTIVEQHTFMDDIKLLSERTEFQYKK